MDINFIKDANANDIEIACSSKYTWALIEGMLDKLIAQVINIGDEIFIDLGVNKPVA